MLQRRDEPLPVEAIRDVLGLVRSIYRAEKAARANPQELAKIERVGKLLRNPLDLASSSPGTMGHRAAWENAEEGARRVADLVSAIDSAEPIVKAAIGRVRRSR